jgi:hypothetical protein
VSPILDDARFDYLRPRVDATGNLYFIRRPYELPKYETKNIVLDTLLFPFRLVRALFHYLNFFSLMYSRKPLTSASGPERQADIKEIMMQGKRIDAQKAIREFGLVRGVPSLVPASWELVKRDEAGHETILARNVASYDLSSDGTVVHSNGFGIFVLGEQAQSLLAHKDQMIGEITGGR